MTRLLKRKIGDTTWHVLQDWESVLIGPEGLRLDQWRRRSAVEVVKHGGHRTVYRVELSDRAFFVTHYRCRRFWEVARHVFRASAARREWRKAEESNPHDTARPRFRGGVSTTGLAFRVASALIKVAL